MANNFMPRQPGAPPPGIPRPKNPLRSPWLWLAALAAPEAVGAYAQGRLQGDQWNYKNAIEEAKQRAAQARWQAEQEGKAADRRATADWRAQQVKRWDTDRTSEEAWRDKQEVRWTADRNARVGSGMTDVGRWMTEQTGNPEGMNLIGQGIALSRGLPYTGGQPGDGQTLVPQPGSAMWLNQKRGEGIGLDSDLKRYEMAYKGDPRYIASMAKAPGIENNARNAGILNTQSQMRERDTMLPANLEYRRAGASALRQNPQIAWGNLGVAQGNLALRQQMAPWDQFRAVAPYLQPGQGVTVGPDGLAPMPVPPGYDPNDPMVSFPEPDGTGGGIPIFGKPQKAQAPPAVPAADPWKPYGTEFKNDAVKMGYSVYADPEDVQAHMRQWDEGMPADENKKAEYRKAWSADIKRFNETTVRGPGWSIYGTGGPETPRPPGIPSAPPRRPTQTVSPGRYSTPADRPDPNRPPGWSIYGTQPVSSGDMKALVAGLRRVKGNLSPAAFRKTDEYRQMTPAQRRVIENEFTNWK